MIEIEYEIGTSPAELRAMFAAEVGDEELVEAHAEPWLFRGLEPPRRTLRQLRAGALASLLEHAKQPPAEHVLTLKNAAPVLEMTERSLRHAVDQGDYAAELTETRDGLRALRFQETSRTWRPPRARKPDPRVLALMAEARVQPGESFEWQMLGEEETRSYRRRADGENWRTSW
jgi:hypothetical protein